MGKNMNIKNILITSWMGFIRGNLVLKLDESLKK